MVELRPYGCASGWFAIVALLGNVLVAFVPAKAAQIVDDILGPAAVCAADSAQTLSHEGGTPKPTLPDSTKYPCCTLENLERPDEIGAFVGLSPLWEYLPASRGARRFIGSRAPSVADDLRLGGNRSRAPPPVG